MHALLGDVTEELPPALAAVRAGSLEDLDAVTRTSGIGAENGFPGPLSVSAGAGCVELMRYLLVKGSDPNHHPSGEYSFNADHGRTPLAHAVLSGNPEAVVLLLDFGADPRLPDSAGNTILHLAANRNTDISHDEVVEVLLEAGADPNAVSDLGSVTPLTIAAEFALEKAFDSMLAAGGIPTPLDLYDAARNLGSLATEEAEHIVRAILESGVTPSTHVEELDSTVYEALEIEEAWGAIEFIESHVQETGPQP